jgi:beta-mannanase
MSPEAPVTPRNLLLTAALATAPGCAMRGDHATGADAAASGAPDAATAPDATVTSPKAEVLAFLAAQRGVHTLAGQHDKDNSDPHGATDQVTAITGAVPAFYSADFGFGSDQVDNRAGMIAEVEAQWRAGAIVQLMYHNCIPTRDELCSWDDIGGANPQHLTDEQWTELVTDGTALNAAWKARLDTLAVYFAQLQADGVAPLFRPLHEMNQGVFWWGGRGGADGTRKLYQITHDYLVKVKGLDQIIWVWDLQDFDTLATDVADYDPGAAYYDLAALDVYDGGYDQAKYDTIRGEVGDTLIAIGECSTVPTPAELDAQPLWSFFMLWPDFIDQNAGLAATYASPRVLTRDEMPGW